MTSLRVALKLSMAATQGTPSASVQSNIAHQSSASKNSHVAKSSSEKSNQKQSSTTVNKDKSNSSQLSNSASDAQSFPAIVALQSQNENYDAISSENVTFSPVSTQNSYDDDIRSVKKAGSKGVTKNSSRKEQVEAVLNEKKKRPDLVEATVSVDTKSRSDITELIISSSNVSKSDDENPTIPIKEANSSDFNSSASENSDVKNENYIVSEITIDVKKSPDYFYCSTSDAISDIEPGQDNNNIVTETDLMEMEIASAEAVIAESSNAHPESKESDAPVLHGEEIDVDENVCLINDKVAEPIIENVVPAEVQVSTEKKKLKRKRTPSILKALDRIEMPEPPAGNSDSDDDSTSGVVQRYQSNRAAAKVAKTKFSSRFKVADETDNGKLAAESAVTQPPKQEWVMCDLCKKWRSIASHINERDLPDEWFCHMNTWSEKYSTCDSPEEPYQKEPTKGVGRGASRRRVATEDAVETTRETRVVHRGGREGERGGRGGRGNRGRWGHRRIQKSGSEADDNRKSRRNESGSDDGDAEPTALNAGIASARKKPVNKPIHHSQALGTISDAVISPENWVLCNKCDKWRKVPKTIAVESLPETWYCSLNTWNPAVARCSIPQEKDDSAGAEASLANIRPRRVGNRHAQSSKADENDQWVQCEHRNCQKWRRVPAHIDIKTLPEIWYCEMNTWDVESAKCSAPQKDNADERFQSDAYGVSGGNKKPAGVNHNLITANSKGSGTLSYRRIIFGNDGRIRSCFSDKNKNGFGLFSYPETTSTTSYVGNRLSQLQQIELCASTDSNADETAPDTTTSAIFAATNAMKADYPTKRVTYWWSSAYNEAAIVYSSGAQPQLINRGSNDIKTVKADDGESQHTTCLLDAVRKIGGYDASAHVQQSYPSHGKFTQRPQQYRKTPKSWKLVGEMGILHRDWAECCAVRSCFLLTPSMSLTMPLIVSLLSSITFQREDVDAVREQLLLDKSCSKLRIVFRRLEERGEAEVSYTSTGSLSLRILYISDCPDIHSAMNSGTISSVNVCDDNDHRDGTKWVRGYSYRNSFTSSKDDDSVKKSLPPKMRKFYDLKGNLRWDASSHSGTSNRAALAQDNPPQNRTGVKGRKMNAVAADYIVPGDMKALSDVKVYTGRGASRKVDAGAQQKGRKKKVVVIEDPDQESVASLPKAIDNVSARKIESPDIGDGFPAMPALDKGIECKTETGKDISDSESLFSSRDDEEDEDNGNSDEMVVDASESVEDLGSIKRESRSEEARYVGESGDKVGGLDDADAESSEFESGSDSETHDAHENSDPDENQIVDDNDDDDRPTMN